MSKNDKTIHEYVQKNNALPETQRLPWDTPHLVRLPVLSTFDGDIPGGPEGQMTVGVGTSTYSGS
ncbi:MAG: hypothetical protein AAF702_40170 [Chloroflexota bacterium]